VTSNVKKLIEKVFDENVAYNFKIFEKLKNIMENSKIVKNSLIYIILYLENVKLFILKLNSKLEKFIPDSNWNTDNAWLEYVMVKYQDDENKLFEEIPLNPNGQLKWVDLDHLLEHMKTDKDVEKNLRKLI